MTSVCTDEFWSYYDSLDSSLRRRADNAYRHWRDDSKYPAVKFEKYRDCKGFELWSAKVTGSYRAVCVRRDDNRERCVWFWIGTHAEYDKLKC